VSLKKKDVSHIRITSINQAIALMMGTVHASETPVYFNETTRRYIPEGCHLHTKV
jgi:hypothetical protein